MSFSNKILAGTLTGISIFTVAVWAKLHVPTAQYCSLTLHIYNMGLEGHQHQTNRQAFFYAPPRMPLEFRHLSQYMLLLI